jgi:23S rRNA U2552 (ribose-2'-O)-methylase RlmE/FtsJ
MVKKIFFCLNNNASNPAESPAKDQLHLDADVVANLYHVNDVLHNYLDHFKNKITEHHRAKKWDRFKKHTNDYELVFTSSQGCPSIASHNPISRSYFKLWEILHDINLSVHSPECRAAFLADAPGGFVEAFVDYRRQWLAAQDIPYNDQLHAISLKATNRIIPQWKFGHEFCTKNQVKVTYGKTGTGDLYDISVIDDFVETVGARCCDFITADGGFDFSKNFNAQENMSTRLIVSEIYAALNLQAQGGSLVLKVFDIHQKVTIQLLYVLSIAYSKIHFVKPLSSRPANSEKYVVCESFQGCSGQIMQSLREVIVAKNPNALNVLPNVSFVASIIEFNHIYISCQALYICKTLEMIEKECSTTLTKVVQKQVRKAIKWCHKYKIPVALNAVKHYRPYFPLSAATISTPSSASPSSAPADSSFTLTNAS